MPFRIESSVFLAIVLVLLGGRSADGQPCVVQQIAKFLADDGVANDMLGSSVAIFGTTALVGAPAADTHSGAAYLFDATTGQQIKLLPDVRTEDDHFGYSVAISGTTAIVGAWGDNGGTGAAYLFDLFNNQQIAKLVADDGRVQDLFGWSVAMSGTTAIVGARLDGDNGQNSGSVYLFDTFTGQQIAKLLPDDGAVGDEFGWSVAISGTTAIVGAKFDDDNGNASGSAYLFDTTTQQQIGKLLPQDGAAQDEFGWSVAIFGTTAIVGAVAAADYSGAAYLFDATTGQQIVKLVPDDGQNDHWFGYSVAISGTTAIVGAIVDDDNGNESGAAYLFDAGTGVQCAKILPDDGAAEDHFGFSVAMSGTTAIIGANLDDDKNSGNNSGSAYQFEFDCPFKVAADSLVVTRGTYVSGGIAELVLSDDADLTIRRATSDLQSRTEFEVKAVSPVANPSWMEVTLEGALFARGPVNQTIELFDYVAGQWEQIDTRLAVRITDSTVTVAATGDVSRFVEVGTRCMRARVRYQSPVARQRFASNTDQFIWTIR